MNVGQETVLVVDDEANVRNLLQRVLTEAGYNVVTAANGAEALYKLSSGEAKVVLMDIKMPEMSGIEVLGKLADDWPQYCVVMVTAVGDVQTAIDAMKLGAYDYITKPFDQNDVKEKLHKAIAKWHLQAKEKQRYFQLSQTVLERTQRMQEQFGELVKSLSREHQLLYKLAAGQPDGGNSVLSKLPPELREPIGSFEEFRDALIRILKRS